MLITIGIFHILLPIILLCYILFANKKYDKYVYILLLFTFLGWIVCDGECIITFFYKKHMKSLKEKDQDLDTTLHDKKDAHKFMVNNGIDLSLIDTMRILDICIIVFSMRILLYNTLNRYFVIPYYIYILLAYIVMVNCKEKSSEINDHYKNNDKIKIFSLVLFILTIFLVFKKQ